MQQSYHSLTSVCLELIFTSILSRREFAHWNRERPDAAGPLRAGQGVPADLTASLPADGGARGAEHPGHRLREEEPRPGLLPQLAQEQDPTD